MCQVTVDGRRDLGEGADRHVMQLDRASRAGGGSVQPGGGDDARARPVSGDRVAVPLTRLFDQICVANYSEPMVMNILRSPPCRVPLIMHKVHLL